MRKVGGLRADCCLLQRHLTKYELSAVGQPDRCMEILHFSVYINKFGNQRSMYILVKMCSHLNHV